MKEPSVRNSRLALAGGLVIALLVGGGGFLLGRQSSERQLVVAPPSPVPLPAAEPPAVDSQADRLLDRGDLIALVAQAADATAAGKALPPDIAQARGRRFAIRLPFGCAGAADPDSLAPMRWRYDEGEKALRLHAAPVAWTTGDWWPTPLAAPVSIEAIEGFWLERPWTSSDACPPAEVQVQSDVSPGPPPTRTLALAQFFKADDARRGRREGKAFEAVLKVAPDAVRAEQGFRLRVSGRIENIPDGAPVLCHQRAGPDQRPVCVIAMTVDEVAIENGVSGEVLATWSTDHNGGGEPDRSR